MIADTHPLKAIAITSLKSKEEERPSAQQLNRTLSGLKQAPAYTQSFQQAQTGMEGEGGVESLRSQIQDLQQRNHTLQEEMQQKEDVISQKQRENEQLLPQVHQIQQQLQEKEQEVQQKARELQEKDHALQTSEQQIIQFQQTLLEKDRVICDLQQTISAENIGETAATVVQKDVSKLKWKDGKKVPHKMWRRSAVVDGNTVYIIPAGSLKIYSCQITSQDLQWSTLPDAEYFNPSLAVIHGALTTVGGYQDPKWTNSLLSLIGSGGRRQWFQIFPAMPTLRSRTVSVTTRQTLIVAGGVAQRENLDIVEMMDIPTKQWSTASHLPHPFGRISGTICGDQLYLAGGWDALDEPSKSVLTCSVTDLLSPPSLSLAAGVWCHARDLPVIQSTLITFGGHLLAIGGEDDSDTADIHCYDTHTDSWQVVSKMKNKRRLSLAAVLPENYLLVVGGHCGFGSTDSVEIGSLQ